MAFLHEKYVTKYCTTVWGMEGGRKRLWEKGGHLSSLTDLTRRWLPENHQTSRITCRETIVKERFWRMRPDGIAVLAPVGNKTDVFCILEHKRMSDVCGDIQSIPQDRYLLMLMTSTCPNIHPSCLNFSRTSSRRLCFVFDMTCDMTSWTPVPQLLPSPERLRVSHPSVLKVSSFCPECFTYAHRCIDCLKSTWYNSTKSVRLMYLSVYDSRDTTFVTTPSPSPRSSLTHTQSCIGYHNPTWQIINKLWLNPRDWK